MEQSDKLNNTMETETISKNKQNLYQGKEYGLWIILASFIIAIASPLIVGKTLDIIGILLDTAVVYVILLGYLFLAKKILLNKKYDEKKQKTVSDIVFFAIIIIVFLMVAWFNSYE